MRKVPFLLAAACISFVVPAHAQSVGEKTGINSVTGTSPSTADFVMEAAMTDMFEIEAGKVAQQKGSPAARTFASHMVDDHTKLSQQLKTLVSSGDVKADIPTALDSSHQSKLDKMKSLNGDDFNKNYDDSQRSGHKDAVSLYERYSKGGDNAKLKAWAAKTLPTIQEHEKMAENLKP